VQREEVCRLTQSSMAFQQQVTKQEVRDAVHLCMMMLYTYAC
jgi:hypothetical protein